MGNRPDRNYAMYPGRRRPVVDQGEDEEDGVKGGFVRNRVLPFVFIGAGLALFSTQLSYRPPQLPSRVDLSVGQGIAVMLVAITTLLGASVVAAGLLKLRLGHATSAALKLASIAIFAMGLATPVARLDMGSWSFTGLAMGYHILILSYWILLSVYFRMEVHEVLLSVAIIAVLQSLGFWAVLA